VNKDKRCKNCKNVYLVHIAYVLDEWDDMSEAGRDQFREDLDKTTCNQFKPMSNLDLLEWEYQKTIESTPTSYSLK
jgi:hypothetical protein